MEKISKSHEVIRLFKEINKNQNKEMVASDDLEVLSIALQQGLRIPYVLYSFEESFQPATQDLLQRLIAVAEHIYEISSATYELLASKSNHAGILAAICLPIRQLCDLEQKSFLMVLDGLEIPGNVGTIYRTLDACQADGIILVDPVSKYTNPKLTSAARGTNLIIPTVTCSYEQAQDWLQAQGYQIFLGEPLLGKNYQEYDYQGKIALVVGNERFGINQDWYAHPHKKVFIPMSGHNNSLNVSVAASIIAYEAYMKRKK